MISRKSISVVAIVTPFWFLAVYLVMAGLRPDYSFLTKAVSELGSVYAPHRWWWNVLGYILPGLAIALLGAGLKSEFSNISRYAWIPACALIASGLFMVMSGVFPGNFVNRAATTMILHAVGSLGSGVAFFIAGFWLPLYFRKRETWRWLTWPSLALVLAAIATGFLRSGATPGLGQRLTFTCFFLWIGLVGFGLARSQGVTPQNNSSKRTSESQAPSHANVMQTKKKLLTARLAGGMGITAFAVFWVALFAFAASRTDYSHLHKAVSELGVFGAPHALAWNLIGFIVPGLLLALFGAGLANAIDGRRGALWWLLVLSGLCFAATGVVPGVMQDGQPLMESPLTLGHLLFATVAPLLWAIASFLVIRRVKQSPSWKPFATLASTYAVVCVGGFLCSMVAFKAIPSLVSMPGLAQRFCFAFYFGWFLIMSFYLRSAVPRVRLASS